MKQELQGWGRGGNKIQKQLSNVWDFGQVLASQQIQFLEALHISYFTKISGKTSSIQIGRQPWRQREASTCIHYLHTPSICENDTLYSSFNRDNCRMHPLREFSSGSFVRNILFCIFFIFPILFMVKSFFKAIFSHQKDLCHLFCQNNPLPLLWKKGLLPSAFKD